MERYFRTIGPRRWSFFASQIADERKSRIVDLLHVDAVKIKRHVKIRSLANPYAKVWQEYFSRRKPGMFPAVALR